jgi:anti-sigma factor RsiW
MTSQPRCPEGLVLSQLHDDEIAADEKAAIHAHLEICQACKVAVAEFAQTHRAGLSALESNASRFVLRRSTECLSSEELTGYVDRVLPAEDTRRAEAHVASCDACLREATEIAQLAHRVAAGAVAPVPDAIRRRVAALWPEEAPADDASLVRLVVRIAKGAVSLLERHLVPPVLAIEELSTPMPATRTKEPERADAVRFVIHAPKARIRATLLPEGEAIQLALTLIGLTNENLPGQRVFVRQHGRSMFSARTDAAGELRTPRLEPGVYEVSCPGIRTAFRLDLRS